MSIAMFNISENFTNLKKKSPEIFKIEKNADLQKQPKSAKKNVNFQIANSF